MRVSKCWQKRARMGSVSLTRASFFSTKSTGYLKKATPWYVVKNLLGYK